MAEFGLGAKLTEPDLQEESVSSGRIGFAPIALAQSPFDESGVRLNPKTIRQMRSDAEVHAAVEFLVDAIVSDGVMFVAAKFEADPEFQQSEEIKDFINRCFFETPQTAFIPTLKELIRGAIYHAHKIAEVICRTEEIGPDAGKLVLDKLKVKPNNATAFVVDEFLNVLGFVGIRHGQMGIASGSIPLNSVIQKDKFFVCTLETEDSDPRGVSQVKAAFQPHCDKQETRAQFSVWRRKCAIRTFLGYGPEKATALQKLDENGKPIIVNGVPQTISPLKAISNTLANLQNDTVAVFPFGTDVKPIDADGTGAQFKLSYDLNNSEIRKSILLQTMATGEADKGGLGTGGHQTHERVLGRRVNSFRTILADQIFDLGRLLTSINFGADKAHLTPNVSLGNFDKSEIEKKLTASIGGGYALDSSQFDELDVEFNFPRRTVPDENHALKEQTAIAQADETLLADDANNESMNTPKSTGDNRQ